MPIGKVASTRVFLLQSHLDSGLKSTLKLISPTSFKAEVFNRFPQRPAGHPGEPEPATQATLPAPGPNKRFLAELKAMGAGPSCYP